MLVKIQWWPHFLDFSFLRAAGVILAYPKHRDNRYVLELPFAGHDIFHPSKEPWSLLTSQREKG
jgi:hypothetical protein